MGHDLDEGSAIYPERLPGLRPSELRRIGSCDYVFVKQANHYLGKQRPQAYLFSWEG